MDTFGKMVLTYLGVIFVIAGLNVAFPTASAGYKDYVLDPDTEAPAKLTCDAKLQKFDAAMNAYIEKDSWYNANKVVQEAYVVRASGCWGRAKQEEIR